MPNPSHALNAAIRAVQGESDIDAVLPALFDWRLAPIVALAPDAHPVLRALAALSGEIPLAIESAIFTNPSFHDAVTKIIAMDEGQSALRSFAIVAPAGWGRSSVVISDAIRKNRCATLSAAVLIGPNDDAAALLRDPEDVAFTIRRWGQSLARTPTAWIDALSVKERDRLVTIVQRDPSAVARCLPWLPSDIVNQTPIHDDDLFVALDAFARASPTAHARYAAILEHLIARTRPAHLSALTLLACTVGAKDVWDRVQTLIQTSPDAAVDVVVSASWNSLTQDVHDVILCHADDSDICAAIAAARGRDGAVRITDETAIAFFAAIDPKVWDSLDRDAQRSWIRTMPYLDAYLAVRSLGLRPEVLAGAHLNDELITAVRCHACDDAAVRMALFPVAMRDIDLVDACALIAALPTLPSDAGAFFCIASRSGDPDVIDRARAVLHTPASLAIATTLQRSGDGRESIRIRCEALHRALRGWTWDSLAPIMALLDADIRAACSPNHAALAERLALPNQKEELHQALIRLSSLSLDIAIPICIALNRQNAQDPWQASSAADVIANALRDHGDVFLTLMDSLADSDVRTALLPLPEDTALATMLRDLALDNPPSAQRLARALYMHDRRGAMLALLTMPPHHAYTVWQALDENERRRIMNANPLTLHDPIAALAREAIQSNDADVRGAGFVALAARSDFLRTIWVSLPQDVQQSLCAHSPIAVSIADIFAPVRTSSPYHGFHRRYVR